MKESILYIYPSTSTFVDKDIELLSEKFEVKSNSYPWNKKKHFLLIYFIKQFIWLFKNRKSKIVIIMFGGWWAFIPIWFSKFFNQRSILILGGTDCVSYPDFNYGSFRKKSQARIIKYCVKNCSILAPVAEELMYYENNYISDIPSKQGIKAFYPKLATKHQTIYNGYTSPLNENKEFQKVKNSFLTIGIISDDIRFQLKGIDLVIQCAKAFPDSAFTIIGVEKSYKEKLNLNLPNLNLIGIVSQNEMIEVLKSHQFYFQLSISEGFPNSLCEAMLFECVPIVSNVSSMPFIIDSNGYLLYKRNFNELKNLLIQIERTSIEEIKIKGTKSRERIEKHFNLDIRKHSLFKLIEKIKHEN